MDRRLGEERIKMCCDKIAIRGYKETQGFQVRERAGGLLRKIPVGSRANIDLPLSLSLSPLDPP